MRFYPDATGTILKQDRVITIKAGGSTVVWRHAEKEIGVNFVYHREWRTLDGTLDRVEHPNAFIAYLTIEEAIRLRLELDRALAADPEHYEHYDISPNIGGENLENP